MEATTTISQTTDAASEGLTSETSCRGPASIAYASVAIEDGEARATTCGRLGLRTTAETGRNAAAGKRMAFVSGQASPFRGPMATSGPSIATIEIINFACNKGEVTPLLDDST